LVGDILRKKREELGQDLLEISRTLKISYTYLRALEDETFEKLPEEVYVKGYIRKYAEILNIDPEIVIQAYNQQVSPPQAENKEAFEKDALKRKRSKSTLLLTPLLLLLFVITVTFILFPSSSSKKEISISPPPVETDKENILKTEDTQHILEVFAIDTTWLLIAVDNTTAKDVILKPGESIKLQAKTGFSLKIGNAGGVKLIFDGKEMGKPGGKGQVVNLTLP
jgi:cytoskeletal protein RodZ